MTKTVQKPQNITDADHHESDLRNRNYVAYYDQAYGQVIYICRDYFAELVAAGKLPPGRAVQ